MVISSIINLKFQSQFELSFLKIKISDPYNSKALFQNSYNSLFIVFYFFIYSWITSLFGNFEIGSTIKLKFCIGLLLLTPSGPNELGVPPEISFCLQEEIWFLIFWLMIWSLFSILSTWRQFKIQSRVETKFLCYNIVDAGLNGTFITSIA